MNHISIFRAFLYGQNGLIRLIQKIRRTVPLVVKFPLKFKRFKIKKKKKNTVRIVFKNMAPALIQSINQGSY